MPEKSLKVYFFECFSNLSAKALFAQNFSAFSATRVPLSLLDDVILRVRLNLLQCILQVMEFNVQVGDARRLFACAVHDFLANNHHVGLFYRHSNVVAGEVLRQQRELLQITFAPILRRRQKVLDDVQPLAEGRHIDENLALEASQERLVDFPGKLKISERRDGK